MRTRTALGAAILMVAGAAVAGAAELTSGVQVGDRIGAYNCTKVAGAEDGVKVGKTLCYT